MIENYDAAIIGTGQPGPAFANRLSLAGWKIAVTERGRFGGTGRLGGSGANTFWLWITAVAAVQPIGGRGEFWRQGGQSLSTARQRPD